MKTVVIVAPHFPPSNLAAVHRSRYFAQHLPKFGWNVRVLTVDPSYYEEKPDYDLAGLVPADLEVIRTKALPTKPVRLVGDVGIRAFWWHYRELCRLAKSGQMDFLYLPIPANFSAMLGPLIYRKFGIPYGIDYIDPWVHAWPGCEVFPSKAWASYNLGKWLEPKAVRHVSLITAVAPGYYEGVLERNPHLAQVPCVAMPYGADAEDFAYLDRNQRPPYLFDPADGKFHVIYAGAMLPKAFTTLEALLAAIHNLKQRRDSVAAALRLHFIGTGRHPTDPQGFLVKPLIEKYGVADIAEEYPIRIPFLDVLNHLKHAQGVLVLGSSEPHYTPSKVFQAVLSNRPLVALLHARSTAVQTLHEAGTGHVVTFDEEIPVSERISEIEAALGRLLTVPYRPETVNWKAFDAYSTETMTRTLAEALDRVTTGKQF
ncbi:MAG: hypothetical protein K1Y36_18200 [Blastocatellia bacterium]|nr:hypothetical protein [Blastocatellia bacterium]